MKATRNRNGPFANACAIYPRNCSECRQPFIARRSTTLRCSDECSKRHRSKSTPRTRNKRHKRRAIERYSDITPAYEAMLRSKTRKCRICGTYLTSKPDRPNSKHLDHIIPINVGGTHTIGNVRIICRTCNLARPKDGTDYTGPITLWAQVHDVVIKTRPKAIPKPPMPRTSVGRCSCGSELYAQGRIDRRSDRCHSCLVTLGREAARLRASGMKWQDICDALGYTNTGALFGLVRRHGSESPAAEARDAIY